METELPTREQIDRVIRLQAIAYELLCWLGNIAFARPQMLNERTADELLDAERCVAWVRKHREEFPVRLRPAAEEMETFSLLFSSFFQTSFRIQRMEDIGRPSYYRICPNKDRATGSKGLRGRRTVPRTLRRKRKEQARGLMLRGLAKLVGDGCLPEVAESVLIDETMTQDLLLWAWTVELMSRAEGVTRGPAVHTLWQEMEPAERRRISGERVWKARQRLVEAIRGTAGQTRVSLV
jgi:hypothetical protein